MNYELQDQMETDTPLPCPLTDDPNFIYYDSASTDITRTWRKFGWKPLEEKRNENNV